MTREDLCGALFQNEDGDWVTCVLNKHSTWSFTHEPDGTPLHDHGHCDGIDRCEEYVCDDPVLDVCHGLGFTDHNGVPNQRFYEEFV